MTQLSKADLVLEYARQANGSEHIHAHWTGQLRYTDGIAYLAETCGAYWLIDLVASHQPAIRRELAGLRDFQVWTLKLVGDAWEASGWYEQPGDSARLAFQRIEFSDFPVELSGFEWWVEGGVMMLKEER